MTGSAAAGKVSRINNSGYAAPVEVRLDAVRSRRVSRDRKRLIRIAAVILIGIFVLVGMRAYCAYMQHANNVLIEENAYLQAEIDSLSSTLSDEIKVTRIEEVAMDKYGMIFPTADNCINLGAGDEEKEQSLAQAIRSEAYN